MRLALPFLGLIPSKDVEINLQGPAHQMEGDHRNSSAYRHVEESIRQVVRCRELEIIWQEGGFVVYCVFQLGCVVAVEMVARDGGI